MRSHGRSEEDTSEACVERLPPGSECRPVPGLRPQNFRGSRLIGMGGRRAPEPHPGFEPGSGPLTGRSLSPVELARQRIDLERARRIELLSSAWKAEAQPLRHARMTAALPRDVPKVTRTGGRPTTTSAYGRQARTCRSVGTGHTTGGDPEAGSPVDRLIRPGTGSRDAEDHLLDRHAVEFPRYFGPEYFLSPGFQRPDEEHHDTRVEQYQVLLAGTAGLEPATYGFGDRRSAELS